MSNTFLPLNTGATIPALGLGTWQSEPGQVKAAVLHAIKLGYKHIDCAYIYGNENEVGQALSEAFSQGLAKREDLFITTKLWCSFHSRVQQNLDISLKNLGLDYVDLYLMHWPVAFNPNGNHVNIPKLYVVILPRDRVMLADPCSRPDGSRDIQKDWSYVKTWQNMEALPLTGKVKAIGVANFSVPFLQELLKHAKIIPAANQIENHPLLPQQEIKDFCDENGIHITAYSPLGSTGSPLFTEEGVVEVAKKRGISVGCVLLSYHVARKSSVLAKSVTLPRIKENMSIVALDAEDMKSLDSIAKIKGLKRYVYPAFGVNMGFPDKQ